MPKSVRARATCSRYVDYFAMISDGNKAGRHCGSYYLQGKEGRYDHDGSLMNINEANRFHQS
jgi:hypothetical protein